jgi:hypothetical protein
MLSINILIVYDKTIAIVLYCYFCVFYPFPLIDLLLFNYSRNKRDTIPKDISILSSNLIDTIMVKD